MLWVYEVQLRCQWVEAEVGGISSPARVYLHFIPVYLVCYKPYLLRAAAEG